MLILINKPLAVENISFVTYLQKSPICEENCCFDENYKKEGKTGKSRVSGTFRHQKLEK